MMSGVRFENHVEVLDFTAEDADHAGRVSVDIDVAVGFELIVGAEVTVERPELLKSQLREDSRLS